MSIVYDHFLNDNKSVKQKNGWIDGWMDVWKMDR